MKKYQLGTLTVSDKGLQDTKDEIVIELIDRMQKYAADGKAAYENGSYTIEEKLAAINMLCWKFCGLSEFLQITMGIEVRMGNGFLYTQDMAKQLMPAAETLKYDIKQSAPQFEAGAANASGNTGNTTIFNQYNSSPKALSRLEIYRQTKNQLAFARGN